MKHILNNIKQSFQAMFSLMRADAALMVAWLKSVLLPNKTEEYVPRLVLNDQVVDLDVATNEQLIQTAEELILDLKHQGFTK